jgi:hypothetical protein
MTHIPSEALKALLADIDICSFRLVDGTYLIAENIDTDSDNNILHIAAPLQLKFSDVDERTYMLPWLDTEEDELVQLSGDKIIGFTETPFELKLHYHKYFIYQKLRNILSEGEIDKLLFGNNKPQVDNQDLMDDYEGEEWKVDKGIDDSTELKSDKGYQTTSDIHMEWRNKFKNN